MWKLTIYQVKKYETWETEHTVSFESNELNDLLLAIGRLESLFADEKTRYEIKGVEE